LRKFAALSFDVSNPIQGRLQVFVEYIVLVFRPLAKDRGLPRVRYLAKAVCRRQFREGPDEGEVHNIPRDVMPDAIQEFFAEFRHGFDPGVYDRDF
jgi:hypothetical protein